MRAHLDRAGPQQHEGGTGQRRAGPWPVAAEQVAAELVVAGRPELLTPEAVLELQRTAGNAAVSAALEAHGPVPEPESGPESGPEPVRSPVLDVVGSGGGRPLDGGVRADMEARLGHGLADVRVHDDAAAHASAVSVDALAYTVGSDIVFRQGGYDPGSVQGRRTLAHELTHVIQQRSGPVDGTPAAGGIQVSDPADRFEREASAVAERVTSADAGSGVRPADARGTDGDGGFDAG